MNRKDYLNIAEIFEDLRYSIDRAMGYYSFKAKDVGLVHQTYSDRAHIGGILEIFDTTIEVEWDEYGSYGYHNAGTYYINSEMLFDETYEAFIDDMVKNQRELELKKAKDQREKDMKTRKEQELQTLADLKAKYENNS